MSRLQCLVLSDDPIVHALTRATLKEYCLNYRRVPNLEMLGPLSNSSLTIGWFIDLDCVQTSVSRVVAMAVRAAPEAKVVFFSSNFTKALAEECLRHEAAGLLVKPILTPRLVYTVNFLRQEPELFGKDELIPMERESLKSFDIPSEDTLLRNSTFGCPTCDFVFQALRMKPWAYPIFETDTDFCPICPNEVFPELYSIMVCPNCYYANYVGRFERSFVRPDLAKLFTDPVKIVQRRSFGRGMVFQGHRTHLHGVVSFELAAYSCTELGLPDSESLIGEFYLKMSWLCRRMGKTLQEQDSQIEAIEHFMKNYRPYLQKDGKFPTRAAIKERLFPGEKILRERPIIIAGFLVAELSRRLGLFEQAEFYFNEVLQIPFLPNFTVLYRHIVRVRNLMRSEQKSR